MKLEKLTEKEKVEELDYTKYDTFLEINQLLAEELGKKCERHDAGDKTEDEYLEETLERLAVLIANTRGRYERNKIKFKEEDIFSYKKLQKRFPLTLTGLKKAYKFGLTGIQSEELIKNATTSMLKAIETKLSEIPNYDPKYKSKELDKSIRTTLKKVSEYAQIGTRLGKILTGMEMERKGLLVQSGMEQLTKTKDLMKKIKNEHIDKIIKPLVDMHAEIYGLPFNGNSYAFLGGSGEKIDWTVSLAKMILDYKDIITEAQVAGRKKFLSARTGGELHIQRDAEIMNKTVKEQGLAPTISDLLARDGDFERDTNQIKSPFEGLEDRLHALGLGYELSKKMSQYLSEQILCRGTTTTKNPKEQNIYKTLAKKINTEDGNCMDEYAKAMKTLLENISGKKIPDFAFSYFSKEEAPIANAISGWVLVTKKGKDGKSKIIHEDQRNISLEELLETAKKQFTKKEYEILVTENTGVCFTFDFLMGYTVTSNFKGLIEAQNNFEEVSKADKLAGLLYKTEVLAHETTHASQINSKLMWRNLAMNAATHIAKLALKWYKEGKLDCEVSEGINCFKKQTYRQELVDYLEEISAQALGLGEEAEKYRQKGIYDAIIEKGAKLRRDGNFNQEYFSKIRLENSKAADFTKRIKKALKNKSLKGLRELKRQADDYSEEISSMVETMAETFGITATKDFIKNYPQDLPEKEKQRYSKDLVDSIIGLGLRAEKFAKISSKYKEYNEKMEKELNKEGMTYRRILTKYGDSKPVTQKLMKLGYSPLNPERSYEDMQELERRVKKYNKTHKKNISMEEVYLPLNNGKAQLDIRYRKNIPIYMKVVEKYGPEKAHELMLNAESLKEIERLVKY